MIHPAPMPELVDALGVPLRQEHPETFAENPEQLKPLPLNALAALREIGRFGQGPYALPRCPFDKVARSSRLPIPATDDRDAVHFWLDEQRRILFVSPDLFERIRRAA